jgi:import inner membrane translocase subunit TIM16
VTADTQPREAAAAFSGQTSGTDAVTRTHMMTLDEACNILNVKSSKLVDNDELTQMLKVRSSPELFSLRVSALFP